MGLKISRAKDDESLASDISESFKSKIVKLLSKELEERKGKVHKASFNLER